MHAYAALLLKSVFLDFQNSNFSFMVFLASLKQCVELSFRRFLIVLIHKQLYNFQFFCRRANKKARALPYKIVW